MNEEKKDCDYQVLISRYDIPEILLKVALHIIILTLILKYLYGIKRDLYLSIEEIYLTLYPSYVDRILIVFRIVLMPEVTLCFAGCNLPVLPKKTRIITTTISITINPVNCNL